MNGQHDNETPETLRILLERVRFVTDMTVATAAALLAELTIEADDLAPWLDFGHPVQDSYGRKLLRRGPNFELMVMSWAPGDYSAIHDHGVAEWGAVRYFGAADHVVFQVKAGSLSITDRMTTKVGMVYPVDSSLIHLMGNPTQAPFLSLHLYGRASAAESITGSARIFDLWERKIQRTDGGVFYCLPEDEITAREPCPPADLQTTLLHHRLMLTRIERIGTRDPQRRQRASELRQTIQHLESTGELQAAI